MTRIIATVIADSINTFGSRLTTFELTYPRFIHAEFMTHRMFSRNSSSSRAIPVKKMITDVIEHPVVPLHWGKNQAGMQAREELDAKASDACFDLWLAARDQAVKTAQSLMALGLHKQIANRLLEPWMHITVICTSSTFENFFKLRCHPDAEPHIQALAYTMRAALEKSKPVHLTGDTPATSWHLPFVSLEDRRLATDISDVVKKSVARCARGSYLQQSGDYTLLEDIELHDRLAASGHWSPFEHQASACKHGTMSGNLGMGWTQYRKLFQNESGKAV